MGDLEPITRNEKLWSGEDLTPVTRKEMYIKHLYDETQVIPDHPVTREEMFILKAGEELHDVTIEQLTATENRTYSEEGVAYSPVIVNVPQTTLTTLDVTENGTYTAPSGTAYNEVEVDVPLPDNAYLLKDIANTPASIATFTDGSPLPMPKLEIAVEPQQSGSGDPSPENIRPISGWSAVDMTRTGKNLFGGAYNEYFPIHFNEDKNVIGSADVPSEGTNPVQIAYYDKNKTLLDYWGLSTQYSAINNRVARSFTLPKESYYLRYITQSSANYQIEFGETNSAYEPYNGHTYTIDLDGTRYGGKVDLVSGVMTLTHGYVKLTDTDYNWQSGIWGGGYRYYTTNRITDAKNNQSCQSSIYKAVTRFTEEKGIAIDTAGNTNQIDVRTTDFTSLANWKSFLASNPVDVRYELATPLTIQLTPTVVKSLRGVNNVYADTGNILDLSYLAKEE